MDSETKKFIIENVQKAISLNVNELLGKAIEVAAKQKDKEIIADLTKHYANLNQELVIKMVEHSEKMTDKSIEIFQSREASYVQGGKMQKLFSFKKWSSISNDSFYTAISDTKEILDITNPLSHPEVRDMLCIRKKTEMMLGHHLSNMFADEPMKKINFKGIGKILGFSEED